jgi:hypothetical protein
MKRKKWNDPPILEVYIGPFSITSRAPYMILQNYFSHPSLVIYFLLLNPTIKLKLGLQIGERLLIATIWTNRYDSPIENREQQSDQCILTLVARKSQ